MSRHYKKVHRSFKGWKRDKPDHRDYQFAHHFSEVMLAPAALPVSVDLQAQMPHVYDQGEEGSCTANAVVGMLQFIRKKKGLGAPMASRNFNYYFSREIEGTAGEDAGAEDRDAIQVLTKHGWVCETPDWPYLVSNMLTKPPLAVQQKALVNKVSSLKYARVLVDQQQIKSALAAGFAVMCGADVFSGIDSDAAADTGYVPLPVKNEQPIGGHAFLLVGYDDASKRFKWRNSWGSSWGKEGYGYFDYAYILNPQITGDLWVMTMA